RSGCGGRPATWRSAARSWRSLPREAASQAVPERRPDPQERDAHRFGAEAELAPDGGRLHPLLVAEGDHLAAPARKLLEAAVQRVLFLDGLQRTGEPFQQHGHRFEVLLRLPLRPPEIVQAEILRDALEPAHRLDPLGPTLPALVELEIDLLREIIDGVQRDAHAGNVGPDDGLGLAQDGLEFSRSVHRSVSLWSMEGPPLQETDRRTPHEARPPGRRPLRRPAGRLPG